MEKIKTAWSISGAAARAIAHFRMVEVAIKRGEKPNLIIGNSSGSIVAPIAAVAFTNPEILPKAISFAETLDILDMFPYKGNKPFNKKGKIATNAYGRMLIHGHMGFQDIKPLYKKVFTQEYFEIFKKSDIKCIAFGVKGRDFTPTQYVLNDAETLDEMIDMIETSSRIVPMVQPMVYKGDSHIDGGFISFNPGMWLYQKYNIGTHISFYSREIKYKMPDKPNWDKGLFSIIERYSEGCSFWLGNKDALLEECLATIKGTVYLRLEAPDGYTDEIYEKDDWQLKALGDASYKKANETWKDFERGIKPWSLLDIN